jgi:Uma2 family endonuclease
MVDSTIDGIQTPSSYIEYPESDGQPMSESDATRHYLVYCVEALRLFFKSRSQVYASGNLFIYYQEGQPSKSMSPDVFVIFGVSQRDRRSYKTWQEGGKLPSFVLEITSLSTRKQDEESKPALYASLGISEYFQYDPTGDYLKPQLKGRRLLEGSYVPIPETTLDDGTVVLPSQTLGLDLRLLPVEQSVIQFPSVASRELRLFDPQTGAKLLNYAEAEQARWMAEQIANEEAQRAEQSEQRAEQEAQRADQEAQRADQETQRADQAEQRLAALLEQMRSQGINPEF